MFVERLRNEKEWEDFLQASPEGTFFHSLKWKEVIQKSFDHHALYLTIRDTSGTLVGLCPGFILSSIGIKIYHSTPYSDYGGPVVMENCRERATISLRSFLQSFCPTKGVAYSKICFTNDELVRFFKSPLSCIETAKGVVEIDLKATPSDFIWNKIFSQNRRKKIKRIEREGFQAREARTRSDMRKFYSLYHKNMSHIGASPYPYEFIGNMWNILYPENLHIWLVEKEEIVSGDLYLKDGQKSYAVFAGIDRELAGTKSLVGYVRWKEIGKAEEEGRRYVSLGSTPSNPENPYHIEKMRLGGYFHQQSIVWSSLSLTGNVLLQTRARTRSVWKKIRKALPTECSRILERKLSDF